MFENEIKKIYVYFRARVILIVAHLINRMPSYVLHFQTPLDCPKESYPFTPLIPDVPLWVFGCTTNVHSHGPNQTKASTHLLC